MGCILCTLFLDVQKCLTANNDRHIINLGIKKVNQSKVGLANKKRLYKVD